MAFCTSPFQLLFGQSAAISLSAVAWPGAEAHHLVHALSAAGALRQVEAGIHQDALDLQALGGHLGLGRGETERGGQQRDEAERPQRVNDNHGQAHLQAKVAPDV
ncbi:MAG: hypothetical protein IPM46_12045 [Flavobacteriales bacterium]|nr:hypothetical protein [Flavobacteriales bacterium]